MARRTYLVVAVMVSLIMSLAAVPAGAAAGTAAFSLTPSTATTVGGNTFTVDMKVDVSGQVNAVDAIVQYPTNLMDLISLDTSVSSFSMPGLITQGGGGSVEVVAGTTGSLSGELTIARLTFRSRCVSPTPTLALSWSTKTAAAFAGESLTSSFAGTSLSFSPSPTTVLCLAPSLRGQGAVNQQVRFRGSGFTPDSTVAFTGTDITVKAVKYVSSTQLNATVSVAPAATVGTRGAAVTTPGTPTLACEACFTVGPKPGTPTVEPTSVRVGTAGVLTVKATGLGPGAWMIVSGSGVALGSKTFALPNRVTANYSVSPTATKGLRNVTVVAPDGGRATCAKCLTVAP